MHKSIELNSHLYMIVISFEMIYEIIRGISRNNIYRGSTQHPNVTGMHTCTPVMSSNGSNLLTGTEVFKP